MQPTSFGETAVFLLLAALAVGFALFTVTRRNPVSAVMSLVATFVALAGIYATLSAHFLAIIQVLVYAGAIMVLFIFVVMILNREEVSPVSFRGILSRFAGGIAALWLFSFLTTQAVRLVKQDALLAVPRGELPADFGTVASIGRGLFSEFVFPFEAISILLLVAIVGGLVVSRSHKQEEDAERVAERERQLRAMITPGSSGDEEAGHDPHDHGGHAAAHSAGGHH